MCGFVGVVRDPERGPVRREELEALLPLLRHRGPDGEGVHVDGQRGLAATRLAIQGGDAGRQPMTSSEGRLTIAFNGEILPQGRSGMRFFLARYGVEAPPPDAGDTALLAATLEAGLPARQALSGSMGALAALAPGATWAMRDYLGVKPLFDVERDGEIWFSSEMKPLLTVAPEARAPEPRGLAELCHYHRAGPWLPFVGVGECPPDSRATYEGEDDEPPPESGRSGESDQAPPPQRIRRALTEAARDAAAVEGPVALFLSGGLDSSAVAAWAERPDLLAVTGRFGPQGGAFDESDNAVRVASHLGLRHEVVTLEDRDLLLDLPDVIRALEMPIAGPGSLALWRLAKHVKGRAKVVLTGTGGDELLGGYARTALVLGRRGPWTEGYERLSDRIDAAGASLRDRFRVAMDRSHDLQPFLSADFLESLPEPEPLAREWSGRRLEANVIRAERHETLPALLHVEDRVLMAHSLEGRPVPCLGSVVGTAAGLPLEWLVGPDGEGKRALREALKGAIPEEVRTDRRKRGFPTPFARAARGAGRDVAEGVLHDRRFVERGWWNVDACRRALDEDRPGHDRGLFAMLSWETWARLFLDGDAFR